MREREQKSPSRPTPLHCPCSLLPPPLPCTPALSTFALRPRCPPHLMRASPSHAHLPISCAPPHVFVSLLSSRGLHPFSSRSFSAVASTNDTTVQVLTRDALQSMQSQAPQLAAALEHALLKYLSFQVNAKLGISDGVHDAHFAGA